MGRSAWVALLGAALASAAVAQTPLFAPQPVAPPLAVSPSAASPPPVSGQSPSTPVAPALGPPPRGPILVSKVVSSIPDGVEWLQGNDACPEHEKLKWNLGKGVVDPSRLAQPVRNELRREGVSVAADPNDPFGARITSDLALGGTVTAISAKLCGGDEVVGQLQMTVVWEVYSTSRKAVVTAVRTGATQVTTGKPVELVRLLDGAIAGNVKALLLNESFRRALLGPSGGSSGAPPAAGAANQQYGPGIARGDFLPHAQERLTVGGLGGRGMVIDASVQSVVSILRPGATGSGFLISRDGWVLTAAHVVGPEAYVQVRWPDGYQTTGEVVRRDNRRDVALIRTDAHGHRPLPMKLAAPAVGQSVFAIGAPMALQGTVTRGIVSAQRTLGGFGFIQSDAAVNPGNSGGPLLNEHGEVVGIADLSNRANPGINFFVPVSDALLFLGVETH